MRYCLFVCLLPFWSYGQSATVSVGINLPAVALLDVEPAGSVALNFTAPSEAGNILGSSSANNSKWINISSAVTTGLTRRVTAQISGTVPAGVRLRLATAPVSGGAGTRGTPVTPLFLSTTAQTIVNGIGGGYTGSGPGFGFNLTYSLDIQTYNLLKSGTYTFSVLYTLADN
jgi:hypothetical protein